MLYSSLLGKTIREDPHDIRSASYALLRKGGFVRQLGQGLFAFLPLGMRVLNNIRLLIAEEMQSVGGQEVYVPVITPAEIWKKSGRYHWINKEMISFFDRQGRELVLSPTHEEAFIELIRSSLSSYRDLPIFLYQFQIKFRDEERTKHGLVRSKEIYMHDAYSLHRSYNELNNFFPKTFAAYKRIFERCGIPIVTVEAGVGYIGGEKSYEFLMPTENGNHSYISCDACEYGASKEIAASGKKYLTGEPLKMEKVETPCCISMDELSEFLDLPKQKLAKSMVYSTPEGLVMAVVRGDYEVGEEKLSAYLHVPVHKLATEEELRKAGFVQGYLSPLGKEKDIRIIVDDSAAKSPNLVFGANEEGFHVINVNYGRDFESSEVVDIALTGEQARCLQCGGDLKENRAIEVGHIFKLGDYYSKAMNLTYQDDRGNAVYPHMGCYAVGLGRLIHAIVETNHDEKGIIWPAQLAPFKVFLMSIGKSLSVKKLVEKLHLELGDDALYDDRDESPGVKFKDADLLGIPVRIVVSSKHISEGLIELKERKSGKIVLAAADRVSEEIERHGFLS